MSWIFFCPTLPSLGIIMDRPAFHLAMMPLMAASQFLLLPVERISDPRSYAIPFFVSKKKDPVCRRNMAENPPKWSLVLMVSMKLILYSTAMLECQTYADDVVSLKGPGIWDPSDSAGGSEGTPIAPRVIGTRKKHEAKSRIRGLRNSRYLYASFVISSSIHSKCLNFPTRCCSLPLSNPKIRLLIYSDWVSIND